MMSTNWQVSSSAALYWTLVDPIMEPRQRTTRTKRQKGRGWRTTGGKEGLGGVGIFPANERVSPSVKLRIKVIKMEKKLSWSGLV